MDEQNLIDWFRDVVPQLIEGAEIDHAYIQECCDKVLSQVEQVRQQIPPTPPSGAEQVHEGITLMLDLFEEAARELLAWLEDGDAAHLAPALQKAEEGWDQAEMVEYLIQQDMDTLSEFSAG